MAKVAEDTEEENLQEGEMTAETEEEMTAEIEEEMIQGTEGEEEAAHTPKE